MKKLMIPLLAVPLGAMAFLLRLWQNRTGFEPDTGLPIPGAPAGLCLVLLLLAWAVCLAALVLRLPQEGTPELPRDFPAPDRRLLILPVAGALLTALAGLADVYEGFGLGNLLLRFQAAGEAAVPSRTQILVGVLEAAAAAALFSAAAACPGGKRTAEEYRGGALLLAPPVALMVRLVMTYRLDSVNPALGTYYVEILALTFLTLAFYRLASFAFQAGQTRRFALYGGAAAVLSLAALADTKYSLSAPLLYGGSTLFLLGFLSLRLAGPAVPAAKEEPPEISPS